MGAPLLLRREKSVEAKELDKLQVLEEFYAHEVWFLEFEAVQRVTGCSIKIEPSGCLCILKARSAEGPKVAFVGARGIDGVRKRLLGFSTEGGLEWRVDQFALDRLGEI